MTGRTTKIFIGGLPNNVGEDTIRESFSRFGNVSCIDAKRDSCIAFRVPSLSLATSLLQFFVVVVVVFLGQLEK